MQVVGNYASCGGFTGCFKNLALYARSLRVVEAQVMRSIRRRMLAYADLCCFCNLALYARFLRVVEAQVMRSIR